MVGTAYMANNLGIGRATVLKYVDLGLIRPLVRKHTLLVAGDEFARFKRETWPKLPKREGRPKKGQGIAAVMQQLRFDRAFKKAVTSR